VVPVFGTGRVRVQPIFVDDLADCLVSLIRGASAPCQTIEIGGPEVITIEWLLSEMRRVVTGKRMRAIHIPLVPVLALIALLETLAPQSLPVTAGQLSTFRFDGIASTNPVFERHRPGMIGVSRMIELSLEA
jgi:NADH dehydrogenase